MLFRRGTVAKCYLTTGNKLKTDVLNKLGEGVKETCPSEKVMVKGHFTFRFSFYFIFYKTRM